MDLIQDSFYARFNVSGDKNLMKDIDLAMGVKEIELLTRFPTDSFKSQYSNIISYQVLGNLKMDLSEVYTLEYVEHLRSCFFERCTYFGMNDED